MRKKYIFKCFEIGHLWITAKNLLKKFFELG